MGTVPFSPIAIRHTLAKSFWQLLLCKHQGKRVSSRLLNRKRQQAQNHISPLPHLRTPKSYTTSETAIMPGKTRNSRQQSSARNFLRERPNKLPIKNYRKPRHSNDSKNRKKLVPATIASATPSAAPKPPVLAKSTARPIPKETNHTTPRLMISPPVAPKPTSVRPNTDKRNPHHSCNPPPPPSAGCWLHRP